MGKERFKIMPAVLLMLIEDNQILLLKRSNTGFMDGAYCLPAGHLDSNETIREGMAREAYEEIGLKIEPTDLQVKLTMHIHFPDREYISCFLVAHKYTGKLENKEPHKCSELKFFPIDDLPEKVIPYVKQAIECYKNGVIYAESGWDNRT
ncbi:MAG: NUDIX domain-containing protein [Proteobacteria bacterium]|nr:NUDIX domain-containing protein [Pseudomonadota bacterium]